VLSEPADRKLHRCGDREQPGLRRPDRTGDHGVGRLECGAQGREVLGVHVDVGEGDPGAGRRAGSGRHPDGRPVRGSGQARNPVLGQVEARADVPVDAEQQPARPHPFEHGQRRALAHLAVEVVHCGDLFGQAPDRRERGNGVVGPAGARPRADRFGDHAHRPGRRQGRVEGGHVVADDRPPGFGNRGTDPVLGVAVVAGLRRDHQRPVWPERVEECLDHRDLAPHDPAE